MAYFPTGVMIESEVETSSEGLSSMIVYWHDSGFVDNPPYRSIVRWMIATWREQFDVTIEREPKEERLEDFVIHELRMSEWPLQIYWENSLGYIAIQAEDEMLIRKAAQILRGKRPSI